MIKEGIRPQGIVHFVQKDKDGNIIMDRTVPNRVVDDGLEIIANRLSTNAGEAVMSHMGVGTDATATTAGDTALGSQVSTRVALDTAGGTWSGTQVTFNATFSGATYAGALTEAGIFNGSSPSAPDMLCRTTFSVINLGASDTLDVTWTVSFADDGTGA